MVLVVTDLDASRRRAAPGGSAASVTLELSVFVVEHYPRLVRLAGLICDQGPDREDAVQAALEHAWRGRNSLRDSARLGAWLDRIVVREAIRLASRRRRTSVRLIEPRQMAEPAGERADIPDRSASRPDEIVAIRAAFDGLPPPQRAAVVLHLYAGYSVVETAEIVGARVETVRSRLRLARRRLQDELEGGAR